MNTEIKDTTPRYTVHLFGEQFNYGPRDLDIAIDQSNAAWGYCRDEHNQIIDNRHSLKFNGLDENGEYSWIDF